MIKSYGVPDKHTPGNIGDIYQDLSTGKIYRCSAVITNPIEYQFMDIYAKSPKTEYDWNELLKEDTLKAFLDARQCNYLFSNNASLTIPQLDTSNVTDMSGMFYNSSSLTTIPQLDTSNVTNMSNTFYNCSLLKTIPQLDTSNVTNMSSMFNICSSLKTIPQLDTSKVTKMDNMFNGCSSLTTIPQLDTSNVTSMFQMFYNCRSLTTISQLDMSNVTATNNMFYNCINLTNLSIKNIKVNLQVGSGTSYGHLLTVDSLLGLCKELITASSSKSLTIGSANLNKLANVYVKRITITDEMREEDPLIDQKIPFEVCDSTDEEAVLITEYTKLKNWTLK